MKTLILLRHGKAVQSSYGKEDFDRSLAPRGPRDIALVAEEFKRLKLNVELVLTSSAKRTLETAEHFLKYLPAPSMGNETLDFLYGYVKRNELLVYLEKEYDHVSNIMVIGHNPTMAYLGDELTQNFPMHLPTSGMLVIDFDVESWGHVVPGSGILKAFIYPKALR